MKNCLFKVFFFSISIFFVLGVKTSFGIQNDTSTDMNPYIKESVEYLEKNYSNGGYDITKRFTHDLPYNGKNIKATKAPFSMCVAAMIEVITHAMDIYSTKNPNSKDQTYSFLPVQSWSNLRPHDIMSHIWVDPKYEQLKLGSGGFGTGGALYAFGMGKQLEFSKLKPYDFVNFNRPKFGKYRTKPSGHAVVFISFINAKGELLSEYNSEEVAGFKYFSHQSTTNGFGYKYAFFLKKKNKEWFCPSLRNISTDCGIKYSVNQRDLNSGRMYTPENWDKTVLNDYQTNLKRAFFNKTKTKGPDFIGIARNLNYEQFERALEESSDVMKLNPLFENADD